MKKYLPFVFPAVALVIVLFLAYRWYNLRTTRQGEISKFGEGVEIENLTNTASGSTLRMARDYKSVELQGEGENMGQVRYEVKDGRVNFMVTAELPALTAGEYQVWLKDPKSESLTKAFVLESSKGGWTGSASLSADLLPFEVVVSHETRPDNTVETILLRGTVNQES